jgi:hypothetical protein
LPLDVWLDQTYVRRVRFTREERFGRETEAIELWEFGVTVNHLDWTRLPTFRSLD